MPSEMDAVRDFYLTALGEIPGVGSFISTIVGLLWPSPDGVWDSIKTEVEALIKQEIAQYTYGQVKEDLDGLRNIIEDYTQELSHSTPDLESIRGKYRIVYERFLDVKPHFKAEGSGYEVQLLPLAAQMASLHLTLLRDGVLKGAQWNMSSEDITDIKTKLQSHIIEYVSWAQATCKKGYDNLPVDGNLDVGPDFRFGGYEGVTIVPGTDVDLLRHPGGGAHWPGPLIEGRQSQAQHWQTRNPYVRYMCQNVLDFAYLWPFFDPAVNPGGDPSKVAHPSRTIYSDPIGNDGATGIVIHSAATSPITAIKIWGSDAMVTAVQVAYNNVWGPCMGDPEKGSNVPPNGWSGTASASNPVVRVTGSTGGFPGGSPANNPHNVQLWFKDGTCTNPCGGASIGSASPPRTRGTPNDPTVSMDCSFQGHILASIDLMADGSRQPLSFAASRYSMVFGFRYPDSYAAEIRAVADALQKTAADLQRGIGAAANELVDGLREIFQHLRL